MSVITRTTCRICESDKLEDIYSLGELAVSTFVDDPTKEVEKVPLDLVLCPECSLLQLRHTAPMELMYSRKYWYKSGINPVICEDLSEISRVALAMQKIMPNKDKVFLDIGANDGTMFKYIPKGFMRRVACEPAENLKEELKRNSDIVISDFWSKEAYFKACAKKADIVTAIGMFYDCEDPNKFIGDVKEVLASDGLFIAQLMTLSSMIDRNDVGNICHEHLEFYSYKSLQVLFERNGLEIFKVEKNAINGGSYRLYARHFKNGSIDLPEPVVDYKAFVERIEKNKQETVEFLKQEAAKGKKIYAYGASTKGNTVLQWYGVDSSILTGVADRNPEKFGKYTVATNVPVIAEQDARLVADYFWILPFAFTNYFVEREEWWHNKGGQFITNTPTFKVF